MKKSLLIFLPDLAGGGAERVQLNLVPFFLEAGYEVTFFLQKKRGRLLALLPANVKVISPDASRTLGCLLPLTRYLRKQKPDIVLSNLCHNNIIALLAARLAGGRTKIIACFHNTLSMELAQHSNSYAKIIKQLCKWLLPDAHAVVAVSKGMAGDLAQVTGLPPGNIITIYNPVITSDFQQLKDEDPRYPWFAGSVPFLLAVGRLAVQKDFSILITAFAEIAGSINMQLLIIGEGPLHAGLQAQINGLGLTDRIILAGYVQNVLPYMVKATSLVMSSRYEGFSNVLVEALACGTPIISTDCPYGPNEILDNGKYGILVPVGDAKAMAKAIQHVVVNTHDRILLENRGMQFTAAKSAQQYLCLFGG